MKQQTTKTQAKKANATQLKVLLLISIVSLIIGGILLALNISELVFGIALFALMFGIIGIIISPIAWYNQNKCINHSFCPHCEAKFDYNTDIKWTESERLDEGSVVKSIVEFTCTCPVCGEEHVFEEKFDIAHYDEKKGAWVNKNLTQLVKKSEM